MTVYLSRYLWTVLIASIVLVPFVSHAQNSPGEITFTECLAISRVGVSGRAPLHTDAVEALIVSGQWTPPEESEPITLPDGSAREWAKIEVGEDGWFSGRSLRGGYAYIQLQCDEAGTMLLDASGHNMVYVNGVPRTGDRYSSGNALIPVQLKQGNNEFLFQCSRGRLRAKLIERSAAIAQFSLRDNTLPDAIVGQPFDAWGAVIVINTTAQTLKGLSILASGNGLNQTLTRIPPIFPYGIRKVGFRLEGPPPQSKDNIEASLQLLEPKGVTVGVFDNTTLEIGVRAPGESFKATFISDIDGSVQYYGVQPAHPQKGDAEKPALFLSLHGASVEGIGQANAYSNKTWGHIVAPTNRRPYGFDWEDWGRMDAIEVLELAQRKFKTDPNRTYLTGHSMGGHGTWQVGVLFPDRFAAIAPSAGWCSFWSYVQSREGADEISAMDEFLKRAVAPSETLSLARNYLHHGVYVLHGDADDNVPVSEARKMRESLQAFHRDLDWYEQPGAGHWWDASDEPGADCVDWAPMFDFFARHRIPSNGEVRAVEFVTANPGVSAKSHWLQIDSQIHALQISSATVRFDPGKQRFVGTTANVERLRLSLEDLPVESPLRVELDGSVLSKVEFTQSDPAVYLLRKGDRWMDVGRPDLSLKGPHRNGPFKQAFRHRMLFVYGTQGTEAENQWALAKARYDAEEFWYRGNGSIDAIPDTEYDAKKFQGRNVILYGNAETNGAWSALLSDSPVQVKRGSVSIGERTVEGDNLSCLFLRPMPNSDVNCIAAVSGTGFDGMRLCDRIPYFVSGVGYPDCIVMGPEVLAQRGEGVRAAGFFGNDWTVENGEFVWK